MGKKILSSTSSVSDGNLYAYHLPRGIVKLRLERISFNNQVGYELKSPELELIPDPNHKYFFQYSPSYFTDDDITVEFSPQGFLSRIHTVIDDQTDEFVNKLGELAETVAEAVGTFAGGKVKSAGEQRVIVFETVIDPFDAAQVDEFNQILQRFDKSLNFSASALGPKDSIDLSAISLKAGVICRPQAICELKLTSDQGMDRHMIRMPHPEVLHFIEIPTASFVKTEFLLEFNEMGYPQMVNIKKPSTAMAAIQMPINILKSIIAIPSKLISLRVNYDNTVAAKNPAPPNGGGSGPNVSNPATRQATRGLSNGDSTDPDRLALLEKDLEIMRRRMNEG